MSSIEEPAQDNEIATRFVNNKNKYSKSKKRLKYNAFIDKRNPQEISIFCIKDLLEGQKNETIWNLANKYVYSESISKVKARADIEVAETKKIDNIDNVFIDRIPIDRHGNIKYKTNERDICKVIAMELAEKFVRDERRRDSRRKKPHSPGKISS